MLLGCTGVIAATDDLFGAHYPALATTLVGVTGLMTLVVGASVVRGGHARARQAPLLDALAERTNGVRPRLGPLAAPRVWCTVGGAKASVVATLVGRNGPAFAAEEEDPFRGRWLEAASAPTARVPHHRHWRITLKGDAPAAYPLLVAAKGPLSLVGASLLGLQPVRSGDTRFDDWVVVHAGDPDAAARLLADPDRRAVLLALVTSNGPYAATLRFGPARSPADPCFVHSFVLHAQQTADSVAADLERLLQVVAWTQETA